MAQHNMAGQSRQKSGVRKRSSNACTRCRQQKIRCTGVSPCQSCSARKVACVFDDSARKILVTKRYISDLQQKAAGLRSENRGSDGEHASQRASPPDENTALQEEVSTWLSEVEQSTQALFPQEEVPGTSTQITEANDTAPSSPNAQLVNPLAIDSGNYMADNFGKAFHLGRSSNWSFGRRVLRMASERLGIQLSTDALHFEGSVYELPWQDLKAPPRPYTQPLPSPDHAIYLINAAKFHCGQMFHLFDEEDFMRNFSIYHENHDGTNRVPELWYIHYLLIIAFGKAFVARNIQGGRKFEADLFLEAMRRLPEIVFFRSESIEAIEILVCAALYLQCLDFRKEAYNLIGQALRKCLGEGMHTQMLTQDLADSVIQRCRRLWWTVYMLDRQMSSLMGLPLAIRDVDVSAPLPTFPMSSQKTMGLELHVKLSRVIANILNTVYSKEGRLAERFLTSTKQALKSIASVKDSLKQHWELPDPQSTAGISRLAAYLHLLCHQCIVLTTRPLAYSFLERLLRHPSGRYNCPTGSVRVLLKTCIESSQQMIQILVSLQKQGLLGETKSLRYIDSFLPFDLESVFISTIILIITTSIDSSLVDDYQLWSDSAYSVLDEMISRGNLIAVYRKTELQKLADVLTHLPKPLNVNRPEVEHRYPIQNDGCETTNNVSPNVYMRNDDLLEIPTQAFHGSFWQEELTADQLVLIADSLDLDGFDWMTASIGTSSSNLPAT